MAESNSHDAVVNLKSNTMNIKNNKNCREHSTKFFSLEESCKEIFFLARFLQDVLQKNALSCKTLKENLARSLQGTQFFSTREVHTLVMSICFVKLNVLNYHLFFAGQKFFPVVVLPHKFKTTTLRHLWRSTIVQDFTEKNTLHLIKSTLRRTGPLEILFFRGRKKFPTTHAIVLFSPDLSMKISNSSETVHTSFIKFCRAILHPKVLGGIKIV